MRIELFLALTLAGSPALGCDRYVYGPDLASKINSEFDYLTCLNNEQADAINLLSKKMDKLQARIDDLERVNAPVVPLPPIVQKRSPEEQKQMDAMFGEMGKILDRNNHPQPVAPAN